MHKSECLLALTSLKDLLKDECGVRTFVTENDPEKWLGTYFSTGCKFTCFAASKALLSLLSSAALPSVQFELWLSKLLVMLQSTPLSFSPDCQDIALVFSLDCVRQLLIFFQQSQLEQHSTQLDCLLQLMWQQHLVIWPASCSGSVLCQPGLDVLVQRLATLKELAILVQALQGETSAPQWHIGASEITPQHIAAVNNLSRWLASTLIQISQLLSSSQHSLYRPALDLVQVILRSSNELSSLSAVSAVDHMLLPDVFEHVLRAASFVVLCRVPEDGSHSICTFIQSTDVIGLDVHRALVVVIVRCLTSVLEKDTATAMAAIQHLLLIPEVKTCCTILNSRLQPSGQSKLCCELFHLLAEDDDALIMCLLHLLTIHKKLSSRSFASLLAITPFDDVMSSLNPHHLFQHLIGFISSDHLVFIDWLVSNETCFLLYLLRYLHALLDSFDEVKLSSHLHSPIQHFNGSSLASGDGVSRVSEDYYVSHPIACSNDAERVVVESTRRLVDYSESESSDDDEVDRIKLLTVEMDDRVTGYQRAHEQRHACCSKLMSKTAHPLAEIALVGKRRRLANIHGISSCLSSSQEDAAQWLCAREQSWRELGSSDCPCLSLEEVMTVLIRLRLLVERLDAQQLFPYSPGPLLRLLCKAEDLYENESG